MSGGSAQLKAEDLRLWAVVASTVKPAKGRVMPQAPTPMALHPVKAAPVTEGSRYVSMIWLNGDDPGSDFTGCGSNDSSTRIFPDST